MADLSLILQAIERGDPKATDELLPIVYSELRRLASQKLSREKPGQTLQATALVHEAYIRLVGTDCSGWDSRGHFFSAAAESMRRILIEQARRKKAVKRGCGEPDVSLRESDLVTTVSPDELLSLDEVLELLEAVEPEKARVVKLRFFGGLTNEEVAECMGLSPATTKRYWVYARAWLRRALA